jgi:hypothetical protein
VVGQWGVVLIGTVWGLNAMTRMCVWPSPMGD